MDPKRPGARTCSAACRKALSRAGQKAAATGEAQQTPAGAHIGPGGTNLDAADRARDAAPERGRLEESVRAKFEDLRGADYEDDPLAVHILAMARALDLPGSMAPGSLTGMGKAFRDAYKEYLREYTQPDLEDDPVAAARAAAEAQLQQLSQAGAS